MKTSLPELVAHVAGEYRLGDIRDWSVLDTGYEDCNLDVRSERGRMVVKVFAASRPASVPARTAELIAAAQAVGVRHPRLYRDASGAACPRVRRAPPDRHGPCSGPDLLRDGPSPDGGRLGKVIQQAARIHRIEARPEPVFDPWAIANLVPLAGQVGHLLDDEQRHLVGGAVAELDDVSWDDLPHALIHADLTAGQRPARSRR